MSQQRLSDIHTKYHHNNAYAVYIKNFIILLKTTSLQYLSDKSSFKQCKPNKKNIIIVFLVLKVLNHDFGQ